jgi:hypothetical protein
MFINFLSRDKCYALLENALKKIKEKMVDQNIKTKSNNIEKENSENIFKKEKIYIKRSFKND